MERLHAQQQQLTDKLDMLHTEIYRGNERMDQFKLVMNWNQEEFAQWALAAKQKVGLVLMWCPTPTDSVRCQQPGQVPATSRAALHSCWLAEAVGWQLRATESVRMTAI